MLHRVKDLSPEQRHAAEILLGYSVSEDEAVSIKRFGTSTVVASRLLPEERIQALRALDERLANGANKTGEEDTAVSDAMRSTRGSSHIQPICR